MLPNYLWKHVVGSDMSPEVYHKNQEQNPTLHNTLSKKKNKELVGWKQCKEGMSVCWAER